MILKSKFIALCFISGTLAAGAAQAVQAFEGRAANGAVDLSCTAQGTNGTAVCPMFYSSNLNLTILNNWTLGTGAWRANAAAGSAQQIAADAGFDLTGLTGWVLPTGDGSRKLSANNQIYGIYMEAGGSQASMQAQFKGMVNGFYWTNSAAPDASNGLAQAWRFSLKSGTQTVDYLSSPYLVMAVRPGDVAAAVPEPETVALLLAGLGVVVSVSRRRRNA